MIISEKYISVATGLSVFCLTIVISISFSNYVTNQLIKEREASNLALTKMFSNSVWPQFKENIGEFSNLNGKELRRHALTRKFTPAVKRIMHDLDIVKVKVYAKNGNTVYSTQASQLGEDKSKSCGFKSALNGKPISKISRKNKLNSFENEIFNVDVVASYIPMFNATGEVEAVIEVYDDITPELASISQQKFWIFILSFVLISSTHFLFYNIYKRNEEKIHLQHEKLLDANSKLKEAQKISNLGSWSWDINTGKIIWSDEVFRIFGLDKNKVKPCYQEFLKYIHPDDLKIVKDNINSALEGLIYEVEHRVIRSDGRVRFVHDHGEVVFDKDGNPLRMFGTIHDVTDRKQAVQALLESEERFSLAMRGANDGLWDWNLETDEVYYSPRWKSMLGFGEDELGNHLETWVNLVHPDDKPRVMDKVQDCLDGHTKSFESEMRMHHKNGDIVYVLSRAFFVDRNSENKPARLIGTHVDITDRKLSEAFVEKNAEILEMIAVGRPAPEIYDAIALMYEGRNPGIRCSMLELHGNKLMHGGAPSLPKEYCDAVNGLENGPEIGSCGTSTYTGKQVLVENIETDPKWANIKDVAMPHGMRCCWSEPIKNSAGKVLGAFGMYRNQPALPTEKELKDLGNAAKLAGIIMERVHNEIELKRHRQILEELVEERTAQVKEKSAQLEEALEKEKEYNSLQQKFVSLVSHEFRTPLTIIDGAAQRLIRRKNSLKPEDIQKRAESVRSAVKRLISLIDLTLYSSRLDAKKIEVNPEQFDLQYLVREVCDRQGEIAPTFKIDVDIRSLPNEIIADKSLLDLVFTNLMSNAIKYSPENRYVKVVGKAKGDHAEISVTDHGIGIPKDDMPNMFKRYFRAKTSKGIGGTGIGLNISKEFVELHGGSISLSSEEGEGSTFTVSLPLEPAIVDQQAVWAAE